MISSIRLVCSIIVYLSVFVKCKIITKCDYALSNFRVHDSNLLFTNQETRGQEGCRFDRDTVHANNENEMLN